MPWKCVHIWGAYTTEMRTYLGCVHHGNAYTFGMRTPWKCVHIWNAYTMEMRTPLKCICCRSAYTIHVCIPSKYRISASHRLFDCNKNIGSTWNILWTSPRWFLIIVIPSMLSRNYITLWTNRFRNRFFFLLIFGPFRALATLCTLFGDQRTDKKYTLFWRC